MLVLFLTYQFYIMFAIEMYTSKHIGNPVFQSYGKSMSIPSVRTITEYTASNGGGKKCSRNNSLRQVPWSESHYVPW